MIYDKINPETILKWHFKISLIIYAAEFKFLADDLKKKYELISNIFISKFLFKHFYIFFPSSTYAAEYL